MKSNLSLKSILESIEREYMPQVHHNDLPAAISILRKNGINVSAVKVLPTDLKSSQSKVNRSKVESLMKDIKSNKFIPPIIISNDNYIVDGHLRWIARRLLLPNKPMSAMMIDLPKAEAIIEYKKVETQV